LPDLIIKPTNKYIKAGSILLAVAIAAIDLVVGTQTSNLPHWVLALPLLLFLWPLARLARRRFSTATVTADRLRFETGVAGRSTRNIQLSKIQDVRVDQSVTQRMFGVGNLSIETAGEASRLTLLNVDKPQELADEIMNRVPKSGAV